MADIEIETLWWAYSSLFQGMCALYGIFLVFYVYMRSGMREVSKKLGEEYESRYSGYFRKPVSEQMHWELKDVGRGERKVRDMASILIEAKKCENQERMLLAGLGALSFIFVIAGVSLMAGLSLWFDEIRFSLGLVLGLILIVGVGVGFMGISILNFCKRADMGGHLKSAGTSAGNLVKRGQLLFENGICLDWEVPYLLKSLDELRARKELWFDVSNVPMEDLAGEWKRLRRVWRLR